MKYRVWLVKVLPSIEIEIPDNEDDKLNVAILAKATSIADDRNEPWVIDEMEEINDLEKDKFGSR